MMFLYASVFIFYIVGLPCMPSVFSERRLLCSSEQVSAWYSYEGELNNIFVNLLLYNTNCWIIQFDLFKACVSIWHFNLETLWFKSFSAKERCFHRCLHRETRLLLITNFTNNQSFRLSQRLSSWNTEALNGNGDAKKYEIGGKFI